MQTYRHTSKQINTNFRVYNNPDRPELEQRPRNHHTVVTHHSWNNKNPARGYADLTNQDHTPYLSADGFDQTTSSQYPPVTYGHQAQYVGSYQGEKTPQYLSQHLTPQDTYPPLHQPEISSDPGAEALFLEAGSCTATLPDKIWTTGGPSQEDEPPTVLHVEDLNSLDFHSLFDSEMEMETLLQAANDAEQHRDRTPTPKASRRGHEYVPRVHSGKTPTYKATKIIRDADANVPTTTTKTRTPTRPRSNDGDEDEQDKASLENGRGRSTSPSSASQGSSGDSRESSVERPLSETASHISGRATKPPQTTKQPLPNKSKHTQPTGGKQLSRLMDKQSSTSKPSKHKSNRSTSVKSQLLPERPPSPALSNTSQRPKRAPSPVPSHSSRSGLVKKNRSSSPAFSHTSKQKRPPSPAMSHASSRKSLGQGRSKKRRLSRSRSPENNVLELTRFNVERMGSIMPPPIPKRRVGKKPDDEIDSVSSVSASRLPHRLPTLDEMMEKLTPELSRNKSVRETVKHFISTYPKSSMKKMKSSDLYSAIRCIRLFTSHNGEEEDRQYRREKEEKKLPCINYGKYIFSMYEADCGIDAAAILSKPGNTRQEETLIFALQPKCDKSGGDTLDMVFRKSLRELSLELHEYGGVNDQYPKFISSYLELRLLEKINAYYASVFPKVSILQHLRERCVDSERERLEGFVKDSVCRKYLIRLLQTYKIFTEGHFKDALQRFAGTAKDMRVWTEVSTQVEMNNKILGFAKKVYQDMGENWRKIDATEKNGEQCKAYVAAYGNLIKPFVKQYDEFLSHTLRESELFCWMAFGVATNETTGAVPNAIGYYMTHEEMDVDSVEKTVCFNFALASQFDRPTAPSYTLPDVLNFNKFIDRIDFD